MPKPGRPVVVVEGRDDRIVLEALEKAGLLSGIAVREAGGKDRLAGVAIDHATGGLSVLVVRDLDDLSIAKLKTTWSQELRAHPLPLPFRLGRAGAGWHVRGGATSPSKITLVPAGAARTAIARFPLKTRALDDFLLELVLASPATVEALTEVDRVSHEMAVHKLHAIFTLLDEQAVRVRSSKRLLHLFRGITGFRAAPATYAERVISKAAEHDRGTLSRIYRRLCRQLGP